MTGTQPSRLIEKHDLELFINRDRLNLKIKKSDHKERAAVFQKTLALEKTALARSSYPIIDPSFLELPGKNFKINFKNCNWEREINLTAPFFALYNFYQGDETTLTVGVAIRERDDDSSRFYIQNVSSDPTLPSVVLNQFSNIFGKKFKKIPESALFGYSISSRPNTYLFTSRFDGFIPDASRKEADCAKELFGEDHLYLAAEAQWNCQEVPTPDPLIIGERSGILYLIDSFDCTPTEEYVKQNFMK